MILKIDQNFQHTFIVDSRIYEGFVDLFKDENILHTNFEFAKSQGFEDKVMHGNILNGFLSYFIGELLPTQKIMILSQEINYKKPVYLNNVLHFEASVSEQSEAVSVNTLKFKFINSDQKTVASGKILIKEFE